MMGIVSSLNKKPARLAWSRTNTPEIPEDQRRQRQTFGMIKLLDDSIGRIL